MAQANGNDVVFTGSDGISKLDHEIEKYDPTIGKIIAWVRLPLLPTTEDTVVYLYYGNASCANQQNKTGVWDNNYLAVYHFNETTGAHLDSTANGKNSTSIAVTKQGTAEGIVGPADEFNGTSNKIDLPAIAFAGDKATIQVWVKSDVTSGSRTAVARFYRQQMVGSYRGYWASYINPGGYDAVAGAMNTSWHQLAGTYDGGLTSANLKLYRDGVQIDTSKGTGAITNDNQIWQIGSSGNNSAYWDGIIDEVRISKAPRGADWIKTEYLNQSNPAGYMSFGVEEGGVQPTATPTVSVPTATPTVIPTATTIPTPTPTTTTEWDYKITIPNSDHEDYGLAYPGTYVFNLPVGSTGIVVEKKAILAENWVALPAKTTNDFFNGIEAVREEPATNKIYVSAAFTDRSDEIYLRFRDVFGRKVAVTFDRIAQYYDNRKAAVTFSADDWTAYYAYPEFVTTSNVFQEKQLWLTVGIVTGEQYPASWAGIQTELNEGYVEPASHSKSHVNIPYSNYDDEVGGSRDDIKNNLALPALNRKGTKNYVYAWVEPFCEADDTLRQKLGNYKYLADRNGWGDTVFPSWDSQNGTYGQTFITIWIDKSANSDLATINAAFDRAYQNGKIYHASFHPAGMDWSPNKYAAQHLDYVRGRKDVWYAGFGHIYAYHYLQERGKVMVEAEP